MTPSPYQVKRIGGRWYVLAERHGVTVRLQGFATEADARAERRRRALHTQGLVAEPVLTLERGAA